MGLLAVALVTQCGGSSSDHERSKGNAGGSNTGGVSGSSAGDAGSAGAGALGGSSGTSGTAGEGGAAAEGGVPGDAGAGTGGEPDVTAPTILSTSPADGESGVLKDVNIVVTFSEAMDRAATEASFKTRRLDAGAVTFRWNDAGDVLTVDPNADLEYAYALDLGYTPVDYYYWFDGPARDLAGNALVQPTPTIEFTTLRDLHVFAAPDESLAGHCATFECIDAHGAISIGDDDIDRSYRGFLTFDLTSLPEGILPEHVQSATLTVYQMQAVGFDGPGLVFGTGPNRMGDLLLEHVNYGTSLETSDYAIAPLESLVFSTSGDVGWRSADVTDIVKADLVGRVPSRAQFRLRFSLETNGNSETELVHFETAELMRNPPTIAVLALMP